MLLGAWVYSLFLGLFITLFVIVSLLLILIVLIQKGRGGGLASAFGGAGGNTAFGSKTGDVLTWATSIIFGIFLLLAVVLNLMTRTSTKPVASAPPAAQTSTNTGTTGSNTGSTSSNMGTTTPPGTTSGTTTPPSGSGVTAPPSTPKPASAPASPASRPAVPAPAK